MNGAGYASYSNTIVYDGNSTALSLTAASNQSVLISNPFLNLTYTSFTVEAWIYPTLLTSDRGIFGQCQCSTCANKCFYFNVREGYLYADFIDNYVSGSTALIVSTWYHVAFVYNYNTQQQILYVNGVQDAISSNSQSYQGSSGSIQIGATLSLLSTFYFNGYIESVRLTTRAKSATELLYDASVTAYYSFDLPSPNSDSGPNGLNGSSVNTASVYGRINEAMRFTGATSYFQAYGFYQMGYSMNNKPFSISLWINPSSLVSCFIIQIARQQTNSSCINVLGIYSGSGGQTGQLIAQGTNGNWFTIYGPFITANTWTHVSYTYSTTNGMILYVNAVAFGSTGAFNFQSSNLITWLQIGITFNCGGSISNTVFQGSIDEMYVHSRELTQSDITGLYNA